MDRAGSGDLNVEVIEDGTVALLVAPAPGNVVTDGLRMFSRDRLLTVSLP
jgi:hypothetical protein